MSTWQKLRRDDEKPVMGSRAHWIKLVEAAIAFLIFFGIGIFLQQKVSGVNLHGAFYYMFNPELSLKGLPVALGFTLIGVYQAMKSIFVYLGTRVYLTNERLIYKVGVLFVTVNQVELEEVRATDVNQGPIGGMLNYGSVFVDCIFTEDFTMQKINNPYEMTKRISKAQDAQTDMIPITPVNKAGIEKVKAHKAPQESTQ